ncbi:MAG: Cys-tRNA(Pro) deacylase [Actinomycetota bacterium]
MSTPATKLLTELGINFKVHEYHHDPSVTSYGLEAADKLGFPYEQVFKTLVAEVDSGFAVGIVPVDQQVNLKSLAKAVGSKKAMMAKPDVASRLTGYVVGGISPVGQKKLLPTVIDEMAQLQETILVSGGKRGFDIEISPNDLVNVTKALFAPIAD